MTALITTDSMYQEVKNSTIEEVNELRGAFFAGLRLGLDETDRMEYNEQTDRAYRLIQVSERALAEAMEVLMERPDLVARTKARALASR